ncbi:hypothetical protein [Photobacterium profundum]|uniref:hypothetical protein n=1 Tax=Photobacterium profundum TaxID=74109 RepID=UPI00059DED92|nr:hypothetical protein [Photobacterium profundum]
MMKISSIGSEGRLMLVALLCAALLILGHLLMAKSIAYQAWTEYTVATIPFLLIMICGAAIRYAVKHDGDNSEDS